VWWCDVCTWPIADGRGYLCINFDELREHEQAVREWEAEHAGVFAMPLEEFLTYPSQVRWNVLHRRCDLKPNADAYHFGVERIRTAADVIRWASHLLEKGWITSTNWNDVLRACADQLDERVAA
jgi:hypothetical protein